ncbi:MAG: ribonuclease domain-containing protein [Propionibacteriaceae bacterium]
MSKTQRRRLLIIGGLVLLLALSWGLAGRHTVPKATTQAHATAGKTTRGSLGQDSVSGLPWIDPAQLPSQARDTLALIDKGGPYPYPRNDDVVFSNAEGILPKKKRGYYKEYTVKTPGSSTRGARRIVTGSDGEFYYTDDHYQSFARIKR